MILERPHVLMPLSQMLLTFLSFLTYYYSTQVHHHHLPRAHDTKTKAHDTKTTRQVSSGLAGFDKFRKVSILLYFDDIIMLSRCCTTSGSCTWFSLVGPTRVKAGKSFLFTEKFPCIENKVLHC